MAQEMFREAKIYTLRNGVKIINATPHPITFAVIDSDDTETVETSGVVIGAKPEETLVHQAKSFSLVRTDFVKDTKSRHWLMTKPLDVLVVGSIIAAQAYPGHVVAMTPAKGFERVPPDQKRMNPDKFTTFETMWD